jgi:hypothetical protein
VIGYKIHALRLILKWNRPESLVHESRRKKKKKRWGGLWRNGSGLNIKFRVQWGIFLKAVMNL